MKKYLPLKYARLQSSGMRKNGNRNQKYLTTSGLEIKTINNEELKNTKRLK